MNVTFEFLSFQKLPPTILYYNFSLGEFLVSYHDDTTDYLRESDFNDTEIILLPAENVTK